MESKILQSITKNTVKQHYTSPQLPLAVYREVAAHLRQVTGVDAGLVTRPLQGGDEPFDYHASQIESLWLEYDPAANVNQQRIQTILDYYGKRYQPWKKLDY